MADEAGSLERRLKIVNTKGLHARASARFVQCTAKFEAQVTVSKDGQSVSGTSIMGLMMLAAAPGTTITIACSGKDAAAAMDALSALVANRFGEEE